MHNRHLKRLKTRHTFDVLIVTYSLVIVRAIGYAEGNFWSIGWQGDSRIPDCSEYSRERGRQMSTMCHAELEAIEAILGNLDVLVAEASTRSLSE